VNLRYFLVALNAEFFSLSRHLGTRQAPPRKWQRHFIDALTPIRVLSVPALILRPRQTADRPRLPRRAAAI